MDQTLHQLALPLAMCLLVVGVLLLAASSRLRSPRRHDQWHVFLERYSRGHLKLLAIGTSNILWGTWVDQLAKELTSLGYSLEGGGSTSEVSSRCDDARELVVPTVRLGRPGWYSWGFAFDDCDDAVTLAGIRVKCGDGWRCLRDGPAQRLGPSRIARVAQGADVILLSTWQNDVWSRNACFNSSTMQHYEVLTVDAIRTLVLQVRRLNPRALFLVMARYPYANGRRVSVSSQRENAYVRLGLMSLPRVKFVDYDFPRDQDFYFDDISGHPNCRGGRLMALAALRALVEAGVVLADVPPPSLTSNCSSASCRWSPMCIADGGGGGAGCMPYSPGEDVAAHRLS